VINYRTARKGAATIRGRGLLAAKSVAIVPLSLVRAAGFALRGEFVAALHPVAVMLGRWMAALGIEPRQYGPQRRNPIRFWIQMGGVLAFGGEFPELG
jgi:hypothetical protein